MKQLEQLYDQVIEQLPELRFNPLFGAQSELLPAPELIDYLAEADVRASFVGYAELLASWSKRIDLVADATPESIIENHIQDSLAFAIFWAAFDPNSLPSSILDIGSGAGLPGVVLALAYPNAQVVLCEPRSLRGEFLKEVRRRLKLKNVEVAVCRVEQLGRSQGSGKVPCPTNFSHVVSRAVGDYNFLVPLGISLLYPQGSLGLMLGPSAAPDKSQNLAGAGSRIAGFSAYEYRMPGEKIRRVFAWKTA